jgi:hypothetical protein
MNTALEYLHRTARETVTDIHIIVESRYPGQSWYPAFGTRPHKLWATEIVEEYCRTGIADIWHAAMGRDNETAYETANRVLNQYSDEEIITKYRECDGFMYDFSPPQDQPTWNYLHTRQPGVFRELQTDFKHPIPTDLSNPVREDIDRWSKDLHSFCVIPRPIPFRTPTRLERSSGDWLEHMKKLFSYIPEHLEARALLYFDN